MRVAFLSPMPPAKSGIADYSAALVERLQCHAEVQVFAEAPARFDESRFDISLYQIGNNPWHSFAYEAALARPGVVVLHEANLHHLITDLTIRRGDWEAYLRECEYNGGPQALAQARRVQALEEGPDYDGLPMTRRLLERSRAVIVHSSYMVRAARAAGFSGPIARIPHGAWLPEADRWEYRGRLGVPEDAPLIGIFGFLKPYKRIAESLRAFRRLLRVEPRARMILAGEPHPDCPLSSLIAALGISANVRVLGFVPAEDFTGCIAACDIVLNLRYPTVGESSGSLQRALGLARPVLVSDVGSFCDFPDDVCLKVPVDSSEEDTIFEYLSLLVSQPEVARNIGRRAQEYVKRECTWEAVARQYATFLETVVSGAAQPGTDYPVGTPQEPTPATHYPLPTTNSAAHAAAVLHWTPEGLPGRSYVDTHLDRLRRTLEIIPPGGPADRILEMGSYLQITPALHNKLGYGEVRGCYYGPPGRIDRREAVSADGERFECEVDHFDAEADTFPYPDGHFTTVLCCELIEHLFEDPMHMMAEINRILRPGGHLVLTTPNIASLRGLSAILQGYHPGLFPQYIRPNRKGEVDPRHNREYTPLEITLLLGDAGFEITLIETGPFREQPRPEAAWVRRLLETYKLPDGLRGDDIYAVGRKTGPVRCRYPDWLYAG